MRKLIAALFNLRMKLEKTLEGLPFWNQLVRFAGLICLPVVRFARATLRAMPVLRKAEWLLEIETLTRRHPVPMAFSMCYLCWRGLHPTRLGHIATDGIIYPFLAAISGFNPFLGIVCGAAFGAGDLLQKLVWPDIFGAGGWGDANYWGAIAGYILAYSSVVWMGFFPGAVSRVTRLPVSLLLRRLAARRVAASAAGSGPTDKYAFLEYYNPQTQTYNLSFKDPRVLQIVKELRDDPRNLFADKDSWRDYALSPEQKLVMAQLRGRGMLGAEGADKLQPILDNAATLANPGFNNAIQPGENRIDRWPPPGTSDRDLLLEQLAAGVAAFLAADASMHFVNNKLEWVAFEGFRPRPDVSCRQLEDALLAQQGTTTGVGAAVGTLAPLVTGVGVPSAGVGGSGGSSPGGGSQAPTSNLGFQSPTPNIGSFIDRWNQVNLNNVHGNPEIQSQLNAIIDEYHRTGHFSESALTSAEQQLQQLDARNAAQFQAQSEQSLAYSHSLINARNADIDAATQEQQNLVGRYNRLIDRVTGIDNRIDPVTGKPTTVKPDLLSAAGLNLINDWHDRVVNPDGSINPAALEQLEQTIRNAKHDQLQQQVNLSGAVAEAQNVIASAWDKTTSAAQVVRNTAFLVEGALLTGGVGAVAGGGLGGHLAATAAGTYYGGLVGGVTAASEAGTMDVKSIARGIGSGMAMGLAGAPLGAAANALHVNPYVAGALIGGTLSAATGGSFVEGAALGAAGLPVANWAGGIVATGGWNSPVRWPGSGASAPAAPSPGTAGPKPPGAVESPGSSSPQMEPWGRPPSEPTPASAPPETGAGPSTSPATGESSVGKPPAQMAGTPAGTGPKPTTADAAPTPSSTSRPGSGMAQPEEQGTGSLPGQVRAPEDSDIVFITEKETPSSSMPGSSGGAAQPEKQGQSRLPGHGGPLEDTNVIRLSEMAAGEETPSSSIPGPGNAAEPPGRRGTGSQATSGEKPPAEVRPQSGEAITEGKITSADRSLIDMYAKNNRIEDLLIMENNCRAEGDIETANLVGKAIEQKRAAGEPDVTADAGPPPPVPRRPDSPVPAAEPQVDSKLSTTRSAQQPTRQPASSSINPNDLPTPGEEYTMAQMDNLVGKCTTDQLLRARTEALARGDNTNASLFESALAEQGYRVRVDPNDLPPKGELPDTSKLENMANKYSFDQLCEMERAAKVRGDQFDSRNINTVIMIKKQQDPDGFGCWYERDFRANVPPPPPAAPQVLPPDFSGLDSPGSGRPAPGSPSGSVEKSPSSALSDTKDPT